MLLKELITKFEMLLKKNNLEENIAKYTFFELSIVDKLKYFNLLEKEVDEEFIKTYSKILNKVISKKQPVQYVFNKAYFYKRDFYVNKNVLIPRSETELIVEYLKNLAAKKDLLEVGCGSGALVITIKKEIPSLLCSAVDISGAALKVAIKNAQKHNADISFRKSDLFKNVNFKYDIIVANLPYLKKEEISHILKKEPKLALDGLGEDGLDIYYRFIKELSNYLKPDGFSIIEHNPGQEEKIKNFINKNNLQLMIVTHKDYNNLNRFSVIRRL